MNTIVTGTKAPAQEPFEKMHKTVTPCVKYAKRLEGPTA